MKTLHPPSTDLRRRGLRLTPQRQCVFESLAARCDHPTADQVYEQVRRKLPDISRATVYRVLDTLVREGLARKVFAGDRGARFDGNVSRHHHLACVRCDRVVDCMEKTFPVPQPAGRRVQGFHVQDCSVVLQGLCPDCYRKEN